MDRFPIGNLVVMQDDLRNWDNLHKMIQFVRDGGFWTPDELTKYSKEKNLTRVSPSIAITRFEDGVEYLHDGHHRCVATWLGGRDYLRSDEYEMSSWSYEGYIELAPQNNWYTPFDPRIHVRKADFSSFKQEAKLRFAQNPKDAEDWLYANTNLFRTNRTIKHLPELAGLVQKELLRDK